jgi:predicted transcriptional regulator
MGTVMVEDAEDIGGRPKTEDDSVFLDVVKSENVVETSEVMDAIEDRTGWELSRMTAIRRLNNLVEEGEIVRKKGNTTEWMTWTAFEMVVSDETFMRALRSKFEKAATAQQISDETGVNEQAVVKRLQKLENDGKLEAERADSDDAETLWIVP